MQHPKLETKRFIPQPGFRITVQTPEENTQKIVDHILTRVPLGYGDYDQVLFKTAAGTQQFRSLEGGHNTPTDEAVDVPCIELSFFVEEDDASLGHLIEAIYEVHPYEEPVIFVMPCLRSLHIRGMDEDNPNRFWNAPPADWVPKAHRP